MFIHDIAADGRWLATREDIRLGVGAHLDGDTADRDLSWLNQSWTSRLSRDGTRLLFGDGTAGKNYGVVWRPTDGSPIVGLAKAPLWSGRLMKRGCWRRPSRRRSSCCIRWERVIPSA